MAAVGARIHLLVTGVTCALSGCGPAGDPPSACKGAACDTASVQDTADTGTLVEHVEVSVSTSGTVSCADPSLRDEQPYDLRLSAYEAAKKAWFWGGGLAVGDLTGDGHDDIVLPGFWLTLFYRGNGDGTFELDTEILEGLPLEAASGGSVADYDGDGDLDLLVTRFLARDVLLRNDDGVLVDVSDEAGISGSDTRSMASSWADYDGDGDLDLFVGSYGWIDESGTPHAAFEPADPSFLYVNDGDGTFTERSDELPPEVHDGYTFTGGFHDLDGDMRPELYVVNDFGVAYPNTLMWNRGGGQLELDGNEAGLGIGITAMGLGLGDLNGDDLPDLLMPEWAGITLLESSDLGVWSDWAIVKGIGYDLERGQKIGWGADLVDIDNDGDLDIPIAFGWLDSEYPAPVLQPDALFLQQPDGTFVDEGEAWGLDDETIGRGYVAVDLNDDGWLDLVKRDLAGPTRMYVSRCGDAAWLRIRLHGPPPNTFAVGARVRVFADETKQVRWVHAGGTNFASGGPPEVHFGLGDVETVDRVEITWPSGEVSTLSDVEPRQILDIHRDVSPRSSPSPP